MSASKGQHFFRIYLLCCICIYVTDGQACPDIAFPASVHVKETVAVGTILFQSNESVSITDKDWGIKPIISGYNLTIVNSSYVLVTSASLNLDIKKPDCLINKKQDLILECDGRKKSVTINIEPVNEYDASFDTSLLQNLIIYENETVGHRLVSLLDAIVDPDCYSTYLIELLPYPVSELDGRDYIGLNNTDFSLYLKRDFDTDELKCTFILLNRTIHMKLTDGKGTDHEYEKITDVHVFLRDVDDQPPIFTDQSIACEDRSINHYTATVGFTEEGIVNVSPSEIKAIDSDTTNPVITYQIVDSWPHRYADNIEINQQNATVIVRTSFSNLTSLLNETTTENIQITFILQAVENKTNQVSVNTTLTITVLPPETTTVQSTTEQITTDTETTPELETTSSTTASTSTTPFEKTSPAIHSTARPSQKTDILDILVIVLPIVAGVLLIIFLSVVVMKCRASQKRNSKYPVGKGNNSIRVNSKSENGNTQSFRKSQNYADIVTTENPVFTTEESGKADKS